MKETSSGEKVERIAFKMHPRVFAALGADLVTNDVVAVIELVKNSYDAFASNAWIRFLAEGTVDPYIEIEDDGLGMSKEIIEDVWCLIATPHKEKNPYVRAGGKNRRVAGEKGLGRLSVARLGDRLQMLTQAPGAPCWEVDVSWKDVAESTDLSACFARRSRHEGPSPFDKSGTILRIFGLRGKWDGDRITNLEDNLARLISPFAETQDFHIYLNQPGTKKAEAVRIESPEFLSKPKYVIKGRVDGVGNVSAKYVFSPIQDGTGRTRQIKHTWEQTYDTILDRSRAPFDPKKPCCGPFTFEIRAWDIASGDAEEIAEHFDFEKRNVRKAIKAHKGISVYRDGILVLPKSDSARDWLGLDLRRVSKVGTRMSTSQIVGYVGITADDNPMIEDTSDRERLAAGLAVAEFEEQLKSIVALLEIERDEDRVRREKKAPMEDLFGGVTADDLASDVEDLAKEGADAEDAVPLVQAHKARLDETRKEIQDRFVYYSRLATVGTIAQMLVHEIRNRTTAIGAFLSFVQDRFGPFKDNVLIEVFQGARDSVASLERLADTFAPLASRGFRRKLRHSILEERIQSSLDLQRGEIRRKEIAVKVPAGETRVAVDPGELDAILINLITNAAYWIGQVQSSKPRRLEFVCHREAGKDRVAVEVHDNGPGVDDEYSEKIFVPGFTKKPGGIGMGLTVASELVAEYGGSVAYRRSQRLGGACFRFDLPLITQ
jgi:signal transduction histidine kinase